MTSIIYKSVNNDFQVIDLNKEYDGYTGSYPFAIATELSEEELNSRYANEISAYRPFIIINNEMLEAMKDSDKNDDREHKREALFHDSFTFDYGNEPLDEASDVVCISDSQYNMQYIIDKMLALPDNIGLRLYKKVILHMSVKEIAKEEGTTKRAVFYSIRRAKEAMRDVFAECGVIV